MTNVPIICHSCGATGSVSRVTAGLQCRCGSNDLDIWEGQPKTSAWGDNYWDENDELKLPDHLQHTYDTGYNRGREGRSGLQGFQTEHQNAHDLGYSHGKRDYDHVVKNQPWGEGNLHPPKQSAAQGPGTGWNTTRPDALSGWDEYAGPAVGRNPLAGAPLVADSGICPACGGSGKDTRASGGGYDEGGSCRLCHGTGKYNPPTSQPQTEQNDAHQGPASGGARWQTAHQGSVVPFKVTYSDGSTWTAGEYTAGRTSADPMGSAETYVKDAYSEHPTTPPSASELARGHKQTSLPLDQAACPNCRHTPTEVLDDHKGDSWWNCPNCGSLANMTKDPSVNPYDPPFGHTPDRSMKVKAGLFRSSKKVEPSRLMKMISAIIDQNPGITAKSSLTLARRAILQYPEESN